MPFLRKADTPRFLLPSRRFIFFRCARGEDVENVADKCVLLRRTGARKTGGYVWKLVTDFRRVLIIEAMPSSRLVEEVENSSPSNANQYPPRGHGE